MGILDRFRSKSPDFNLNSLSNSVYTWDAVTPSTEYLDQYEHWTYKSIKTISDAVSSTPLMLYQKKGDEMEEVEVDNSQMLKDLYHFNQNMHYAQARRIYLASLLLTGSSFLYMAESDLPDHKVEFFLLDSQRMSIVYDDFGLPDHYLFRTGAGDSQKIEMRDLIELKLANPKEPFKGHSPLQAARYAHNIVELGMKYNMNVFGNSGRPEGFLIMDGATDDQRDLVESKLKQKFGGVQNGRKIGVLNRVVSWLPISEKPKDLDYGRSIDMFRDQILSVFGVPKTLVGIDDSTYANASEAVRTFQRYTVKPLLELEAEVFETQLIGKYHRRDIPGLTFGFVDPVESDKVQDAEVASKLYAGKIITLDEARKQVGLEPTDEMLELEPETNDKPKDGKPEDQPKEGAEDIEKKIDSIIGKIQSIDEDLRRLPEVEEQRKNGREELRKFFETQHEENEMIFRKQLWSFFTNQRLRVLKSLIKRKQLTLKGSVDWDAEVIRMVDMFNAEYKKQAKKANKLANEFTNVETELSKEAQESIKKRLDFYAKNVNKTTRDKIEKIIADGIRNGTNPIEVANQLNLAMSGFMEGEANISLLKKHGVYIEALDIKNTGTIYKTKNRYEGMYKGILDKLEGQEQIDALRALYAVIDENDAVGLTIRDNITKVYGISVDDTKLSRLWTIARTEIGNIQSDIQYENYKNSGVVSKLEWLTARDRFVRGVDIHDKYDHISADGQTAYIGENFLVSGEFLKRPLDPAGSKGNTINCRCVVIPVLDTNE